MKTVLYTYLINSILKSLHKLLVIPATPRLSILSQKATQCLTHTKSGSWCPWGQSAPRLGATMGNQG